MGQGERALGELVRAADLLPADVPAQVEAAKILLAGGRFEDARTRAEAALKLDPSNAEAHVLRAGAAAGLRDNESALEGLNVRIKFNPNRSSTYIDRARFRR